MIRAKLLRRLDRLEEEMLPAGPLRYSTLCSSSTMVRECPAESRSRFPRVRRPRPTEAVEADGTEVDSQFVIAAPTMERIMPSLLLRIYSSPSASTARRISARPPATRATPGNFPPLPPRARYVASAIGYIVL
jgi:hypothetical protein